MNSSGLWMRARALRWSQRFTLALVVLAAASGAGMFRSWADRSASCAVASRYSDSLAANRMRFAGIDRLLTRYDLSQADQISVQLERRKKASAAEVMAFDSMRVFRNAFEDSLPGSTRRQPEEAPPTYSLDNPFTQRARIVRALDALKRLGADTDEIKEFLNYELLTPVKDDSREPGGSTSAVHAPETFTTANGPGAVRLRETLPGESACSAYRRERTRWSLLLLGSVLSLVAGWWLVIRSWRARQSPS